LEKSDLSPKVAEKLTLQEYGAPRIISGVKLVDFDFHSDDGGDLHEITRLTKGVSDRVEDFEVRQVNRSRFNPGLVKAFHLHLRQDEVWAVHPLDRLLVGLLDVRKGSATEGVQMRFVMGAGNSRMLYIPRGVAHGGMVLGASPVDVVYLMSEEFSRENPDEWRLPWDLLGADFWQITKG
jgi:dTDP-4-dehydrorhamnose 3,5-epimerase